MSRGVVQEPGVGSTAPLRRRRSRAMALLGVLALAGLWLAIDSPPRPAHYAFERGVLRLGHSSGRAVVGGVSRPVLDGEEQPLAVQVPGGVSGTLELAAVASGGAVPSDGVPCRVTLQPAESASKAAITAELEATHSWKDIRMTLPDLPKGGSLSLGCTGKPTVRWAQPVVTPPEPPRAPPLVIVLSLDTLRADRVSGFADTPVPTPALAALASEGTIFTAAASPYTWTLPAHFALFYSRFFGFPAPGGQEIGSLATTFSTEGYATAGFTGGGFVGSGYHFDQGFDRYAAYDASAAGVSEVDTLPGLLEDAEAWIRMRRAAPTFVFLHTYAVHERPLSERENMPGGLLQKPRMPSAQIVRDAREFYDQLVARLDSALSPFFDHLRDLATRRPVLLVLLSDHGEAFGEHGGFRHGAAGPIVSLHDEVVRIPMIFWAPGVLPSGGVLDNPFSLFDVGPTLLAATGLPRPASMIGRDFWPLLRRDDGRFLADSGDDWDAAVISHRPAGLGAPAAWSTRTASRKQISVWTRKGVPVHGEVYELDDDPGERVNRIGSEWKRVALRMGAELRARLQRVGIVATEPGEALPVCRFCDWDAIQPFWDTVLNAQGMPAGSGEIAPETKRRLQSLGYLE